MDRSQATSSNLPNDYAELATLMPQFNEQLAKLRDNMHRFTETAPAQARLTTLWEEQARDWQSSNYYHGDTGVANDQPHA